MKSVPSLQLKNGVEIPHIGLGTWKMREGDEAQRAVAEALSLGYRLIDTAKYYGNERSVGRAIRASGIPRDEIFVTTKLWPTDFFDPRGAFEKSMELLNIGPVDLYLIHWPIPAQPKSIWRVLEKIYDEKLARAIGVSNYGIGDIESLLSYARTPPAVNQIKFSPFDRNTEVRRCCSMHDIVVEAYSPLTRGHQVDHPTIIQVAKKYHKTPAQIMLRWCIEHGTVPIPKTTHLARMKENIEIFDFSLEESDMAALNSLY